MAVDPKLIQSLLFGREQEELQSLEAQVLDQVLSGGLPPSAEVPLGGGVLPMPGGGVGQMSGNAPQTKGLMETILGFGSPEVKETALTAVMPGIQKAMGPGGITPKLQRGEPYEMETKEGLQWVAPIYDMNKGGALVNVVPQPGRVAGKEVPMYKVDPDGFLIQRNAPVGRVEGMEKNGWTQGKRSASKEPLVKVSRVLPSGDVVSITTNHTTAQDLIRERNPLPPSVATYLEGLQFDTILGDIQGVPITEKLLTPRELEEKILGSQETLAKLKATGGVTEAVMQDMAQYDPGFARFLRASGHDIALCEKLIKSYQKMLIQRLPKNRREHIENILFGESPAQRAQRQFGNK